MKYDPVLDALAEDIKKAHLIIPKKGRELTRMEHYQNEKTHQIVAFIKNWRADKAFYPVFD